MRDITNPHHTYSNTRAFSDSPPHHPACPAWAKCRTATSVFAHCAPPSPVFPRTIWISCTTLISLSCSSCRLLARMPQQNLPSSGVPGSRNTDVCHDPVLSHGNQLLPPLCGSLTLNSRRSFEADSALEQWGSTRHAVDSASLEILKKHPNAILCHLLCMNLQEGWTRWSPYVPYNSNHSVTLSSS